MRNTSFCVPLFLACSFFCVAQVSAAGLSIERVTGASSTTPIIQVILEAQNDDVNAVQGTLLYPIDAMHVTDIQTNTSPVSFWLEEPKDEKNGRITFSGIIPGGTEGSHQIIFSALLEPIRADHVVLKLEHPAIFRNDGLGTSIPFSTKDLEMDLTKTDITTPPASTITDTTPPEPFNPIVAHDPNIFDNQWFVSFATKDTGTGVQRYFLYESPTILAHPEKDLTTVSWRMVTSPALLKNQQHTGALYIKAVDKAGNERIQVVALDHQKTSRFPLAWVLAIMVLGIMSYFIKRKIKK